MKRVELLPATLAVWALLLCCACAPAQGEGPTQTLGPPGPTDTPEHTAAAGPVLESRYYQNGTLTLPEVTPAQTPEVCDGFAALEWGESYEPLFQENLAQFVIQEGVSVEGLMGRAYYQFQDGILYRGQIVFYEQPDQSDLDVYIQLLGDLTERYGQPKAHGESTGLSTPEEAMMTGEGICAETWGAETSQGEPVQITLWFDPAMVQTTGGRVSITFTAPTARN